MTTIDKLSRALIEAEAAERAINNERDAAIREATRLISEQFRERTNAARKVRYEADTALKNAKVAEASQNPFVGKRVERADRKHVGRWTSKMIDFTIYGVVEVVGPQTNFPGNMRYTPTMGSLIVRLEKNDGTVGSRFEQVYEQDGSLSKGWTLAK